MSSFDWISFESQQADSNKLQLGYLWLLKNNLILYKMAVEGSQKWLLMVT